VQRLGNKITVTEIFIHMGLRTIGNRSLAFPLVRTALCPTNWERKWGLNGQRQESPSLEIFKTRLDKVLCSLL